MLAKASSSSKASLGVLGVGGFTSRQDIMDAYERDEISGEQVYSLVRLKEQRDEQAQRERGASPKGDEAKLPTVAGEQLLEEPGHRLADLLT